MIQATHCAPLDKAIISTGPADWVKTYPLLYFYASVFLLFLSLSAVFCFGSADVQRCGDGAVCT